MIKILEEYFQILLDCFKYDIMVYSTKMWIYYWAMIPAIFYTMFFMVKWAALTAPMWMPISMLTKGFPIKLIWNKGK